ncbi:MAG: GerMN domain-containing protein [Anaerolineae bacterium]|nr:GerMN domain-containing protein [Anaerolineae bacterium]
MEERRGIPFVTVVIISLFVVLIAIALLILSQRGFSIISTNPPESAGPEQAAPDVVQEPEATRPLTAYFTSPVPDAQMTGDQVTISGKTAESGTPIHITISTIEGDIILFEQDIAVQADNTFHSGPINIHQTHPINVTTQVYIEGIQYNAAANEIARTERILVNLLPPLPTAAPLPTSTPMQGIPSTSTLAAPAGAVERFTLTYPKAGASVTFPVHFAGYLHTTNNQPVNLEVAVTYPDGIVGGSATLTTITWGSIQVVIYNLPAAGVYPTASRQATLTVREPTTGASLTTLPVTVIGSDEAATVTVFFFSKNSFTPVTIQRYVPAARAGSNLALAELFWGLTPQETALYDTYIPSPAKIYEYTKDSDPRNALVHVRDSYVTPGGVAVVTVSDSIQAATSRERAAEQIWQTMKQFPNVKDVAIAVSGALWTPSTGIAGKENTGAGGVVVMPAATPTPPASLTINLVDPGNQIAVNSPILVSGSATVPNPGETLRLTVRDATTGNLLIPEQTLYVGTAAPGQIGAFQTSVPYTNISTLTKATLRVSYLDINGFVLAEAERQIDLLPPKSE